MSDGNKKTGLQNLFARYDNVERIIILVLTICLLGIYFGIRTYDVKDANIVLGGGVSVSLCLALFDRLGLLLPIQQKISQLTGELRGNLSEISRLHGQMSDDFQDQMRDTRKNAAEIVAVFDSYEKYRSARQDFGFAGVAGQEVTTKHGKPHYDPKSVFMTELKNADGETTIFYMNTFLEQYQQFRRALLDAVHSGAHIKILLMNPNSPEICRRRWKDAYQLDYSVDDFISGLLQDARKLCGLRDQAANGKGKIEIRFYSDSINYPLVAVCRSEEELNRPVVVYTGFYGTRTSEEMPYIEWRDGSYEVFDKFMSTFESKWKENENNTTV